MPLDKKEFHRVVYRVRVEERRKTVSEVSKEGWSNF